MRFLVVGYGSIGHRHANVLRELGHAVVALDPAPDAGGDVLNLEHLDDRVFSGVLICTPPDTRVATVTAVREAVTTHAWFIEKPLGALTLESFEHPGRVQVGFCYRYLPSLGAFADALAPHRVVHLTIRHGQHLQDYHSGDYRDRYHGTPGRGGVVLDSLPHLLHLARWLLGDVSLAGTVTGKLSGLDIGTPDTAAVLLRAATGQPCLVLADYLRRPRLMELEAVTGTGATIRWTLEPDELPRMYEAQMQAFCEVASGKRAYGFPALREGLAVQGLIRGVGHGW